MEYEWKFSRVFNIRIAVIGIGLWHIITHVLGFALFISAYYLIPDYCSSSFYGVNQQSNINFPSSKTRNSRMQVSGSLFSFLTTCFLIRGALKEKSTFVLPFLIMQLFDILYDFLVIASYVCLSSNYDEFFTQLRTLPFQRFLTRSGSQYHELSSLLFIFVSFSMKTCLMRIIYYFYKSLAYSEKQHHVRKPVQFT